MKPLSITNTKQTQDDKDRQARLKKAGDIPAHIGIIMDGNGRWAKERGNVRAYGHKVGVDSVRDITEASAQLGVQYLTLYAFSTENWKRPFTEVNALMKLLVRTLRKEAENLNENNIKLTAIGDVSRFPKSCRNELEEAIELTKDNDRLQLCLALSYSGRWDITNAFRSMAEKVKSGELSPEDIDEQLISSHLSTADVPDPDLMIRTSGEFRISNFLLWQLAYSEMYIAKTYWPDFRRNKLYKAIESFQERDRRFGKLSDQSSEHQSRNSVAEKALS